jgi:hypothetical protein
VLEQFQLQEDLCFGTGGAGDRIALPWPYRRFAHAVAETFPRSADLVNGWDGKRSIGHGGSRALVVIGPWYRHSAIAISGGAR